VRSLALALLLVSAAWAKPPQPKPLKSLPPATQLQKQFARDAQDVRLLILASPT
jgi:hypothetical protein